jgi:hypothetical protein
MERSAIIRHLIRAYGFQSYLEIGVRGRETLSQIDLSVVDGVDPNGQGNYTMTSDEFFESHCKRSYDIIFVDGLHLHEQAKKDIENALTHLSDNGIIVVHDCLPEEEWHQLREGISGRPWNGDVWKAFADLRSERADLSMYVVDTDWGCGIIRRGSQYLYPRPDEWTWGYFKQHRDNIMNVVTVEEFLGYSQP